MGVSTSPSRLVHAINNAGAGETSAKQLTSAEINQKNINDQGPWDPDTGQTVTAGNQKTIEAINRGIGDVNNPNFMGPRLVPDKVDGVVDYSRNAKFFSKDPVEWSASRPKGTQLDYKVFQRNDIEWNQVRTTGDKRFIGKTNAEAAAKGRPPQLPDGNFATLHHLGQKSPGPLVEASTRYHGVGKPGQDILHSQYGRIAPHPELQPDRRAFDVDNREYWKWRVNNGGE